jgi:hypothetical protein
MGQSAKSRRSDRMSASPPNSDQMADAATVDDGLPSRPRHLVHAPFLSGWLCYSALGQGCCHKLIDDGQIRNIGAYFWKGSLMANVLAAFFRFYNQKITVGQFETFRNEYDQKKPVSIL